MWNAPLHLALLALGCCISLARGGGQELVPLEFRNIPVNGVDEITDPVTVTVTHGFAGRTGSKIAEHGDEITLLDSFKWIETPHVKWAAPYANGPVRVLCIVSQPYSTRNAIELLQRSDFEVAILQIPMILSDAPPKTQPAVHEFYWKRFEQTLAREFDVILFSVGDYEPDYKGFDNVRDRLLRRVKEKVEAGCGLVVVQGSNRWYRTPKERLALIHELSPLTHGHGAVTGVIRRTEVSHPLTDAMSFRLWPMATTNKGKADDGAMVLCTLEARPVVAVGRCGKGRVVAAYYHVRRVSASLMPQHDYEAHPAFGDYWEPVYSFYLKALAWAAGREPRIALSTPPETACEAGRAPRVTVTLRHAREGSLRVKLRFRLQDPWGVLLHEGVARAKVGPAPREIVPSLPPCNINGLHRLDLWVTGGKRVENWGSVAVRVTGGTPFAVEPLDKAGALGGVARFRLNTGGAAGALHVRAIDDVDRIFFEKTLTAADDDVVEVDLKRSRLPRNRVEFSLLVDGRIVGRRFIELRIPRIGLDSLDGEYVIATYGATYADRHLARRLGGLYREAGFNAVYANWHRRVYIQQPFDLGLASITGGMSPYFKHASLDKELKHSPNKPEVREQWDKNIAEAVDDIRTYGGIGRVLDDEAFFAWTAYKDGEMRGAQADQSPETMALFRTEMQQRYQDIADLNEAWDTDFKDFSEVRCIEEDEIKGKDNPAGWLEFRQYMNRTYAREYYGWIQERHAALGPSYGVGCGAPGWTSREGGPTYRGGDYAEMRKVMRFMMAYGGLESRLFRDAYVGQPGGQKYDPPLEWRQRGPWHHLLNGADALWFYSAGALLGAEMAWRRRTEWVVEGIRDITRGVGALVSRAEPLNRQVRILYSAENLAMGWLFGKRKDAWRGLRLEQGLSRSERTLTTLFDEFLFLQPSYVTAEEVQLCELRGCRLLILPQILNLDKATAEGVRSYVKGGGCVLADVAPGARDRFGKPRARSALADVFGVDASGAEIHRESEVWYSVGVGFHAEEKVLPGENAWLPADTTFTGLEATTAKPQGKMLSKEGREALVCFANSFGKGKALLLNFVYTKLDSETAGWHRKFGDTLVQWAGLTPPARIVHPLTKAPLDYRPLRAFRLGQARLLGAVRGGLVWSGGRPVLIDPSRALDISDQAEFVWPDRRHVYNVRSGKHLGLGTSAQVDLPSYHGRLLALLPYQVTDVRLDAPKTARAGEIIRMRADVRAGEAQPGEHVLHMEVFSPTGYRNVLYCKTRAAPSGRAEFVVPFADNDRLGDWQMTVRDVMTGVEARATVRLQR